MPIPDGTVKKRGRVGRRHDRYAGENREFFEPKIAQFGLLGAALLGGFIVNLSTFWLFCFIPCKTRAYAADGGISMSKTSKTHFSTAQKYLVQP